MASKFIQLTHDNINEKVSVSLDHIVQFYRRPNLQYTSVELSSGGTLSVKETPDDIYILAHHATAA
jgi:hypothetical protein